MGRYRKVSTRIWNDEKFRAFSDDAKLVWLFLLTHPHMTSVGAIRGSIPGFAAELGWTGKRFRKAFETISKGGMVEVDEGASCLVLPRFLHHNPPENPNVVKSWNGLMEQVPECEPKWRQIQRVKAFLKGLSVAHQRAFATLSKELPKPFPKPEPEPEPIQEPEPEGTTLSRSPSENGDVERVIAAYLVHHPRARPGPKERKLIADRMKPAEGWTADQLILAVEGCHESPHHCGGNERGTKYQSLELIMRDSKHVQMFIEILDPTSEPVLGNKSRQAIDAANSWARRHSNDGRG